MNERPLANLSARYARFAEEEASGHSLLYAALARGVAKDRDTLGFLLTMPTEKRQPNLLLGAVRHLFGTPANWLEFRCHLLSNAAVVRSFMLTHSTQTNEPARCATLLPVLARLPQPLALIEVGASAGLCLLPDFYGYDYGGRLILPSEPGGTPPMFTCSASETTPLPDAMPKVVWRAGLDLNPLDVADPSHAAWLETLVWPEQAGRLANLRAALGIAGVRQPRISKGDLVGDSLARLCRQAPNDATLVVFHTAVLAYVADQADRDAFAERVRPLCDFWIANESPRVLPDPASRAGTPGKPGQFLMSVNGRPVAWTDPHGAAINWIEAEDWAPTHPIM